MQAPNDGDDFGLGVTRYDALRNVNVERTLARLVRDSTPKSERDAAMNASTVTYCARAAMNATQRI